MHPHLPKHILPTTTKIFPDSGASICITGKTQLKELGLSLHHLLPCYKRVKAVGGYTFYCHYYIPIKFTVGKRTTTQRLYFRDGNVQHIYLSRTGSHELNILPDSFPYPMRAVASDILAIHSAKKKDVTGKHITAHSDIVSSPITQNGVTGKHINAKAQKGHATKDVTSKHITAQSINLDNHITAPSDTLAIKAAQKDVLGKHITAKTQTDHNMTKNVTGKHIIKPPHGSDKQGSEVNSSRKTPSRPATLPYEPTEANIPKLKKYLIKAFSQSVFNKDCEHPVMSGPPATIHLKPDAVPHACHVPIPVPLHLVDDYEKGLDRDTDRKIISPVPVGIPSKWCSQAVVVEKKDGSHRRAINYQHLNKQCLRETHHCESPFNLACKVPPNTYKTVLDAVDGYHGVLLDEKSRPLTTFITNKGRYWYLRVPQGFIGAGDIYTRRYDDIIRDVKRKIKIVDDTLLYDNTISDAFFHTWDYLALCVENGVLLNVKKFAFCQKTVQFAGLKLTTTGIAPSDNMLSAIRDFPAPKDLTGARSWLGLVNQVSWAYSISHIMTPFRELVKKNAKFQWNDDLQQLFEDSKTQLITAVQDGIRAFNINRTTCIQCDWSKDGIGYLLLQKYCHCPEEQAPICCPEGWKLVYAGSRFTTATERRYAPTEGEALSVAWSLNHARMFVLGCPNLWVATDHKPLVAIFGDKDLSNIKNSRIQRLKMLTTPFQFSILHCPGKWNKGADALSRYPTGEKDKALSIIACFRPEEDQETEEEAEEALGHIIEDNMAHLHANSIHEAITVDRLDKACSMDGNYKLLHDTITTGFPKAKNKLNPQLSSFWDMRERLSTFGNIVLLDTRFIIPSKLRHTILKILHSAHQGCTGMNDRAKNSIFWPGLNTALRTFKEGCHSCTLHAPSQRQEPAIMTPPSMYPFQHICSDFYQYNGHDYLVVADRFSGWLQVWHFKKPPTSRDVIKIFRQLFIQFGAPDEVSSDGGPQYIADEFKQFLNLWGCKHRLSSVEYPQSNGRAEVAVKTGKRLIRENTSPGGGIDTNCFARAILQYRNTPLRDVKLSPAQLLFHRELRDFLPTHPSKYRLNEDWLLQAKKRESMCAENNKRLQESQQNGRNLSLQPLKLGTHVVIQTKQAGNKYLWNKTGKIVEVLPHRQYLIRVDGSGRITRRNRKFLKLDLRAELPAPHTIFPSPILMSPCSSNNSTCQMSSSHSSTGCPSNNTVHQDTSRARQETSSVPTRTKTPLMLRRLNHYNRPGLKE